MPNSSEFPPETCSTTVQLFLHSQDTPAFYVKLNEGEEDPDQGQSKEGSQLVLGMLTIQEQAPGVHPADKRLNTLLRHFSTAPASALDLSQSPSPTTTHLSLMRSTIVNVSIRATGPEGGETLTAICTHS